MLSIEIDKETIERLSRALPDSSALNDKALYALLLGLKVIESGIDSDELIRGIQEPGTGLDLPLMMAKRKTRGDKLSLNEMATGSIVQDESLFKQFGKIPAEAYQDYEFD